MNIPQGKGMMSSCVDKKHDSHHNITTNNSSDVLYHVEIQQKMESIVQRETIIQGFKHFFFKYSSADSNQRLDMGINDLLVLQDNVESYKLMDSNGDVVSADKFFGNDKVHYHIYRLFDNQSEQEMVDNSGEDVSVANHWQIPSVEFHNIWSTLIYDTDVKQHLLNYASACLRFAESGINSDLITWNKVILLHGPPGTGKTSLCKALAHKLSIRLSHKYCTASLLEVNSHSLFSKWFSESGKLVEKMFGKVEELLEDESHLVCLLIDEVESLTAARSASSSSTEPSDAIRVVNALLTQIDRLSRYPNVLILTTSNLTGKIDLAFVSRADIKLYIGNPSPVAIYSIYKSCIDELVAKKLVSSCDAELESASNLLLISSNSHLSQVSQRLWEIANASQGLSGRTLRKLPFLAFAKYFSSNSFADDDDIPVVSFLDAMCKTVEIQFKEMQALTTAEQT